MAAIDVNEILAKKERKRVSFDENALGNNDELAPKRFAMGGDESMAEKTSAIADSLPELDPDGLETMDEAGVKRLLLNFEKRMLKNTEMRIKFPDQPNKFLESEVELNVAVQEMHAIATVPSLYHLLTSTNAVQSLLQLLIHENSDVACAVVDLLQELTDVDSLNESDEGANILIDALLSGQIIAVLVQNLERLNESNKDESDGVFNSLAIMENIFDFRPEICGLSVEHGLLAWLLKRLRTKLPYDANRLYCSEILAVLLQNNDDCKRALGEQDGIDVLLQQLAVYKRHNPNSADETEYMENLFGCLCASLLLNPNRQKFLEGEGLQLMNLMLREKKLSRSSALKVLDYATTGPEGKSNCNKFVDILGLRTLFPLFMKTPSKHKRRGHTAEEHEEHVCSIIASLLKNCSDTNRRRVFDKFNENDHEKVERLTELHFKFLEKVEDFDKTHSRRSEDDEDSLNFDKLDAGLFTLQIIDYILAEVYVNGSSAATERFTKLLSMKSESIKTVKKILTQYAENVGERENKREDDGEHARLVNLVQKL